MVVVLELFVTVLACIARNVFHGTADVGHPLVDAARRQQLASWLVCTVLPFPFGMVASLAHPVTSVGGFPLDVFARGTQGKRGAFPVGQRGGSF